MALGSIELWLDVKGSVVCDGDRDLRLKTPSGQQMIHKKIGTNNERPAAFQLYDRRDHFRRKREDGHRGRGGQRDNF